MSSPHLQAIKTRIMQPPQDDFYTALDDVLPPLKNGDVLCVSAKVLAIHEGRCIPLDETSKDELVQQETDMWLPRDTNTYGFMLTIIHHGLIASAGIDESNSGDYFTLLPKNPTESARLLRAHLMTRHNLTELAVIVTDSHVRPLRWGTEGIAIGAYGLEPLRDYRGTPDLFNRTMKVSQHNIVDALAVTSVSLMGEGAECTPAVLIRDWPNLTFTNEDTWHKLVVDPEADVFSPLLQIFQDYKNSRRKAEDESAQV